MDIIENKLERSNLKVGIVVTSESPFDPSKTGLISRLRMTELTKNENNLTFYESIIEKLKKKQKCSTSTSILTSTSIPSFGGKFDI